MTEGAQPSGDAGASQGDSGGDALYAEHLSAVPEEHRGVVEPALKAFADKTISGKLQEHANYRKQWEPFEKLGVHEYDPEGLGNLLGILSDLEQGEDGSVTPGDRFREWYEQIGNDLGLTPQEEQGEYEGEEYSDPKVAALEQQLATIQEREQQRDQALRDEQTNQHIEQEFDRLKKDIGELPDIGGDIKAQDWVESQAWLLADNSEFDGNPIEAAYKGFMDLVAAVEKGMLSRKQGQPLAPEKGGRPGTGEEIPRDFKTVKAMAAERLRNQ